MALLLQLLFVLAAFVVYFSGWGCYYLSKRYDRILETKFPDMTQSLSTWRGWWDWQCLFRSWDDQTPVREIRRWRKAIKLGDDELTREAKKCCLLIHIVIAGVICLILLGVMMEYLL